MSIGHSIIYPASKFIYDGNFSLDSVTPLATDFFSVYNFSDPVADIKKFQGARLKAYIDVPICAQISAVIVWIRPSNDGGTTLQTDYRIAELYSDTFIPVGYPVDIVITSQYAQIRITTNVLAPANVPIHLNAFLIAL